MNRATGDLKQLECSYRGELDYPASTSEAALNSPEDPEYGDTAHCRATLYRPVVEPAAESEDPEYGDDAHCRAALNRPLWSWQQNQRILSTETPLIDEQLFTDLLWNQQQNQRILSTETPLTVEQLFTDLLQVRQRKQLKKETLIFTDSSLQICCRSS